MINKWTYRISIALVLAVLFYVFYPTSEPDRRPDFWNIQVEKGEVTILGLSLNKSQLKDTAQVLKSTPSTALFTKQQAKGEPTPPMHLEAYFEDLYDEGDRIIIGLNAKDDLLKHIKKQAYHPELFPNGVVKVGIQENLYEETRQLSIRSVTLIAGWQIDFEEFQTKFGEPAQLLNDGQGNAHFLYPTMGLDFIQPADGLQILQFVPPKMFNTELLEPLLKTSAQQGLQ
ncbi:MAG: hypothetical protein R8M46_05990 [Ghiorsea sp.]